MATSTYAITENADSTLDWSVSGDDMTITLDPGLTAKPTVADLPIDYITAYELDLEITSALGASDFVRVESLDSPTTAISGTFSGTPGTQGGSPDGYTLDDWGVFQCEYLSVGGGASTLNRVYQADAAAFDTSSIDVRARVWRTSWTGGNSGGIIARHDTTDALWDVYYASSSIFARVWSGSTPYSTSVSTATMGLSTSTWQWIRVVYDSGTFTFYTSSNGTSWTQRHTASPVGAGAIDSGAAELTVGQTLGVRGLDGRISNAELRNGAGTLIESLDIDNIAADGDSSWTSDTGRTWILANGSSMSVGDIGGTATVRFELDSIARLATWSIQIDKVGPGSTATVVLRTLRLEWVGGDWFQHRILDDRRQRLTR